MAGAHNKLLQRTVIPNRWRAAYGSAPPLNCGVMPHWNGMLLDPSAANAFISGYKQVLLRVAGGDDGRMDRRGILETLTDARHLVKRNPEVLEKAVVELQATDQPVEEEVLRAIRTLRVDNWVYLRDTKSYSVFIQSSGEFALGVLALTQRMRDIVGATGVVIETGVVRYRGRFVCDGLVSRVVHLGSGYRRSFSATYRTLRATGRFDMSGEA